MGEEIGVAPRTIDVSAPDTALTSERTTLDPIDIQVLYLMSLGYNENLIRDNIFRSISTIRNLRDKVRQALGVSTNEGAVSKAIDLGILDPEDVLKGSDPELLKTLSPRHKEIMELLADYDLDDHSEEYIATKLGNTSHETIKTQLTRIYKRLKIPGDVPRKKIRAVAIFAAVRKLNPPASPTSDFT